MGEPDFIPAGPDTRAGSPRRWPLLAACLVTSLLAASLGLAAAVWHATRRGPAPAPPTLVVLATWPGASAEEVEVQVTVPLERLLASLPQVERLDAASRPGASRISARLLPEADVVAARALLVERLSEAGRRLPPDVFTQLLASTAPPGASLRYSLEGPFSALELRGVHDDVIRPALLTTPGVADVVACGGSLPQLCVRTDPDRLAAYGLSLRTVADALARELVHGLAAGDPGDLDRLVVANHDGVPVRLGDVARVELGAAPAGEALRDGQPVVAGEVLLQPGADPAQVQALVSERLGAAASRLPRDGRLKSFAPSALLMGLRLPHGRRLADVALALARSREVPHALLVAPPHETSAELLLTIDATTVEAVAADVVPRLAELGVAYDCDDPRVPALAAISFLLLGDDRQGLIDVAQRLQAELLSVPGVTAVASSGDEEGEAFEVVPDREALARLGASPAEVGLVVAAATVGHDVGRLGARPVVLWLGDGPGTDPGLALSRARVSGATGEAVPLTAVATTRRATRPSELLRRDCRCVVRVAVAVASQAARDATVERLRRAIEARLGTGQELVQER